MFRAIKKRGNRDSQWADAGKKTRRIQANNFQKNKVKTENFLDLIKIIAPGSVLREAIDDIIRARNGALIILDSSGLARLMDGDSKVNCRLTSQKLVELSKMDGAIIISEMQAKILYTNTMIHADQNIPSIETGTRRKACRKNSQGNRNTGDSYFRKKENSYSLSWDIRYL